MKVHDGPMFACQGDRLYLRKEVPVHRAHAQTFVAERKRKKLDAVMYPGVGRGGAG